MSSSILSFPTSFYWGTASAAYQIEGAANEGGRGPSIWDKFSHTPGKIMNGDNGDLACDHYHRWKEDVKLMKSLGLNAYRFSISWSRILPKGKGRINKTGLEFYSLLIDELLEAKITPFVTLNHFDLPQALQDEGGGWLRQGIEEDFASYADIVSHEFGDRVKHWTTFNEPWELAWQGYHTGEDAPGLTMGVDAALKVSHNVMVSHGKAVTKIRNNVQGEIGIVIHLNMVEPNSQNPRDISAAQRWEGCQNRWYLDPLYKGEYPSDMIKLYGNLAPKITQDDLELISQPIDFLGLNMYRRSVVANGTDLPPINMRRINPPGEYTDMGWEVYPKGLYNILKWVNEGYKPSTIYITENGAAFKDIVSDNGEIHDKERVNYIREHVNQANRARSDGVPLKGYFAWSTLDNFEWAYGYNMRFGLIHVDYRTLSRTIKDSGYLLSKLARSSNTNE